MFIFQLQYKETEQEELSRKTIMGYRPDIQEHMLDWSIKNRHLINENRFKNLTGGNPALLQLSDEHLAEQPELKKELEYRLEIYVQSRFMDIYKAMKKYGVADYVAELRTIEDKQLAFITVYSKGNDGLAELAEYKKQDIYTFKTEENIELNKDEEEQKSAKETKPKKEKGNFKTWTEDMTNTPIEETSDTQIKYGVNNLDTVVPTIIQEFEKNNFEDIFELITDPNLSAGLNIEMNLNISEHVFEIGNGQLIFKINNNGVMEELIVSKGENGLIIEVMNNSFEITSPGNYNIPIEGSEESIFITVHGDFSFEFAQMEVNMTLNNKTSLNEEGITWDIGTLEIIPTHDENPNDLNNYIKINSDKIRLLNGGVGEINCKIQINEKDDILDLFESLLRKNNDSDYYSNKLKTLFNSPDVVIKDLNILMNIPMGNDIFNIQLNNGYREINETEDLREISINGDLSLSFMGISISNFNINIETSTSTGTKTGDQFATGTRIYSNDGSFDLNLSDPDINVIDIFTNKGVLTSILTNEGFEGQIDFRKLSETLDLGEEQAVFEELEKLFPNGIKTNGTEIKLLLDIIEGEEKLERLEEINAIKNNNIHIQKIIDTTIKDFGKTFAYTIREFVPRNNDRYLNFNVSGMDYLDKGIAIKGGLLDLNLDVGKIFDLHIGNAIYDLNIDYHPLKAVDLSLNYQSMTMSPYILIETSPKIWKLELDIFAAGSYLLDFQDEKVDPANSREMPTTRDLNANELIEETETKERMLRMGVNVAGKKILEDVGVFSPINAKGVRGYPIAYGEGHLKFNLTDNAKISGGVEVAPSYDYKKGNLKVDVYPTAGFESNGLELRLTRYDKNAYDLYLQSELSKNFSITSSISTDTNVFIGTSNLYMRTGNSFLAPRIGLGAEIGSRNNILYWEGQAEIASGPFQTRFGMDRHGNLNVSLGWDVLTTINYITNPNKKEQ